MKKNRLIVLLAALVLLCAFAFPLIHSAMAKPAVPPAGPHPEMDAALHSLQEARRHLEKAEPVFAGHRVAAIKHVDAAIEEVHAAFRDNP
jgi:hypothetical protein